MSLWTSGVLGEDAAGLTVSSYAVVAGAPGRIVAALDPDADLTGALGRTGTAMVQLLDWRRRDLAEMFGGTMPAPGGGFAQADFRQTGYGPRLDEITSWAGVRLEEERPVGWSLLVTTVIEELHVGDADWLVHRGGRYLRG